MSDTPNGRHSPVEERTTAGKSAADNKLERPPLPEEFSHNGVTSVEENRFPIQETKLTMKETGVKEIEESKQDQIEAQTMAAITPPPATDPPASSSAPPPPPPSLVQSSDLHSEPQSENKATVRTTPPALVGCDILDKQVGEERSTEGMEEMDLNDSEASNQVVEEERRDEGSSDVIDTAGQLQQREHQQDVSEESPGLVIDTGSQLETEDETAPIVIGESATEEHRENKPLTVNSAADGSQVLYEEGMKGGQVEEPSSPQSITSNEEDIELEMDIIEEGEEERDTPPPLPPPIPRGTLMKPPTTSVTSTISQARIGVSPSHTASIGTGELKER